MAVEDAAAQLLGYGCDLAEVTGGEPLLQPAVHPLIARLLDAGMTVLVETSGASDVSRLDARAIKVMDLKCPGSGESARNLWSNLDHLTPRDEVKFVIADRADYEWARDVTRRHNLAARVNAVLMSCAFGKLGAGAAGGMDPGRSAAGADATPDAQTYLGARRARRLNQGRGETRRQGRVFENPASPDWTDDLRRAFRALVDSRVPHVRGPHQRLRRLRFALRPDRRRYRMAALPGMARTMPAMRKSILHQPQPAVRISFLHPMSILRRKSERPRRTGRITPAPNTMERPPPAVSTFGLITGGIIYPYAIAPVARLRTP